MITQGDHTYVAVERDEYFGPVVEIGRYTSVAEKVVFCGSMNHNWIKHRESVSTFNWGERFKLPNFFEGAGVSRGPIKIGSDVWIGREAWLMDGITIGDGAIIGARTMVTKDVPPFAIYVGNPGKVHGYRFPKEQREALLRIKWWEWDEAKIRSIMEDFKDVKVLIEKYDN